MPLLLTLLLALLSTLESVTATSKAVVHEKRHRPTQYARRRMKPDDVIPIRIALRQSNLDHGYNYLMDVSHPESLNYGKHWSAKEAHDFFAPPDTSMNIVEDWLQSRGIKDEDVLHYDNKGWLAVDMTVAQAEELLSTEYYEYDVLGDSRIGCDSFSIPRHVSPHVDFIKPGVVLSNPVTKRILRRSDHVSNAGPDIQPRGPKQPSTPYLPGSELQDCMVFRKLPTASQRTSLAFLKEATRFHKWTSISFSSILLLTFQRV